MSGPATPGPAAENPANEPVDTLAVIRTWYDPGSRAHDILVNHSRCVAEKAVAVAGQVPHLKPDTAFVREAAMLHDIGICETDTPTLGCFGQHPYVSHGYKGRALLESVGLRRHALVCERHVGVGIGIDDIDRQGLPLPRRNMRPKTIEEIIVCYADKFFSKNGGTPGREKSVDEVIAKLKNYGPEAAGRFAAWATLFGDG